MHPIRVGTCGWSYKEWSGVFYPKGLTPGDFLAYREVVVADRGVLPTPAGRMVAGASTKTPRCIWRVAADKGNPPA